MAVHDLSKPLGVSMIELIDQMLVASKNRQFHLALVAALLLPDVCGALESPDGQASGSKYKSWVEKWMSPKYGDASATSLSGDTCWYYRCSLLHQNRAHHPRLEFVRVAFLEPNDSITMHDCVINNVLVIDIPTFCQDMADAVSEWLATVQANPVFNQNLQHGLQRFPSEVVGLGSSLFVYA